MPEIATPSLTVERLIDPAHTAPARGLAPWQVKHVTSYMRENLEADLDLRQLADRVNLSRFYFCSAFRRATGYTPHEYLTRLRIDEARRLLAICSMPVTDIALAVGYQTPSSFAAAFRRLVGLSPGEFRRML
jgi:AraC family transcriptional regulator